MKEEITSCIDGKTFVKERKLSDEERKLFILDEL